MNHRWAASRRVWLRHATAGIAGASVSGWCGSLAGRAAQHPRRTKAVILLWLNGGPATIDLWDMKIGQPGGGPFREIDTSVPGVRISEHLPNTAALMDHVIILRSMTSKEGDHNRAVHFVRTGYVPQAAIQFPALGALVAHDAGTATVALPGFVSIAPTRSVATIGGGFLGSQFSPLVIGDEFSGPHDLKVADLQPPDGVSPAAGERRQALLDELDQRFARDHVGSVVEAVRAASLGAVRLMQPAAAAAFRLEEEDAHLRDAYGRTLFGQGCLLARRLVERGVTFVEVTLDGWDTHAENFARVKSLSGILDGAWGTLLRDLRSRGLLDSTLVVCLGEFGRTPKINPNVGRDHWAEAWSAVLAGGGIQAGQVIGRTSADGSAVEDSPIAVPDLLRTICHIIGLDSQKLNPSNVGRPIRVVDPSATLIEGIV